MQSIQHIQTILMLSVGTVDLSVIQVGIGVGEMVLVRVMDIVDSLRS